MNPCCLESLNSDLVMIMLCSEQIKVEDVLKHHIFHQLAVSRLLKSPSGVDPFQCFTMKISGALILSGKVCQLVKFRKEVNI